MQNASSKINSFKGLLLTLFRVLVWMHVGLIFGADFEKCWFHFERLKKGGFGVVGGFRVRSTCSDLVWKS